MRSFFPLVVIAFVCGSVCGQEDIRSASRKSHIVKIIFNNEKNEQIRTCTGSLISPEFIVTTGHCTNVEVDSKVIQPDQVQFGSDAPVKIASIIRHYRYKPHLDYHNLALIKLDARVADAEPACLWINEKFDYDNFELIGHDSSDNAVNSSVKHMGVDKCHEYYSLNTKLRFGIIHNQICSLDVNGRNCAYDFGGPLQRTFNLQNKPIPFIFGLKSLGESCQSPVPSVYTRLSSYKAWIEAIVGLSFEHEDCAVRFGTQ